jgi:hypothetical protein
VGLNRLLSATCITLSTLALLVSGAEAKCHSRGCWKRVHAARASHWLRVHRPWIYAWRHLTPHERSWAHCIADYETRGIPWNRKAQTNTGNGYYGSTQFLASTARSAGFKSRPDHVTLHEQLVRTVWWAHRAGSSQWSTSQWCGSV